MWASSKSPEIPTSANWVYSHKTFDKEKSPGRFYPIIMSWERYKNIIWVSKIWDSDWT